MTVDSHPLPPPRGEFLPFSPEDIEQSIPSRFCQIVGACPDRLAVKAGPRALSYRDLDLLSDRVAAAILDLRKDTEEPVLILLGQSTSMAAAIVGALKAGKIYVPQDPESGIDLVRNVFQECTPSLIVTDENHFSQAAELAETPVSVINVDRLPAEVVPLARLDLRPDRAACIYFTSGSTGRPRGVVDCHRNVLHNIGRYTNSLSIGPQDRLSLIQSPSFSGAVSSLFSALLNGAAVFPFDFAGNSAEHMARWVNSEALTMFHSVPFVFEQLCASGFSFPTLKVIRLEGDRAGRHHAALFQANFGSGCTLVNGLGATETGLVCQFPIGCDTAIPDGQLPIGYPVQDVAVELSDPEGRLVERAEIGEIIVRSRYLAIGYWRRPDLTRAVFDSSAGGRRYRTGDLGRADPDGCLHFEGRRDFQIKVRGQRIDVAAVEQALLAVDGVSGAVVGVCTGKRSQQLVAHLTTGRDANLTVSLLRRTLRRSLTPVAVPSRYVFLDALSLDANRKVVRRNLRPPGRKRPHLETPCVPPADDLEQSLVDTFRRILEIDQIGRHDDFFDLGGDSLLAAQLACELEDHFGAALPAELLFEGITVARVAEWLAGRRPSKVLVPLAKGGKRSPLFLFHDYGGQVLDYTDLATRLGRSRPVFGLQRGALPAATAQQPSVSGLAAAYLLEIRRQQPNGPYLLAGQCFGGLLAFEAARQLKEDGESVAATILIDTAFPRRALRIWLDRAAIRRHWPRVKLLSFRQKLVYGLRCVGRGWRAAASILGEVRPKPGSAPSVTDIHFVAEARYHVQPYDGQLAFISVGPRRSKARWKKVCRQHFEAVQLSSSGAVSVFDHPTDPSHVERLTVELERTLEAASCE